MRYLQRLLGGALMLTGSAFAAGPAQIAKADGALWPHAIENRADFDTASRAELLVSATVLDDLIRNTPDPIDLGIKRVNADSVDQWTHAARRQWIRNMENAAAGCSENSLGCGSSSTTWAELVRNAQQFSGELKNDDVYRAWLENTRKFYRTYLREQLRLAALFPRITSEILTLDGTEVTGDEFADGQFLLSFDDGPTRPGGYTDSYIALLDQAGVSAAFFSLGSDLEQRMEQTSARDLAALYRRHCLGSHGLEHRRYPRWAEWKRTLERTRELVQRVFPEQKAVMFRPPYGQRTAEITGYVNGRDGRVILWNIDSQDWNRKINAPEMAERVKKLMLVKRRGVLLFHDTKPKALSALPDVMRFTKRAELQWFDCRELGPASGVTISP